MLSFREIIGAYYAKLNASLPPWVAAVSNFFPTDQEKEIIRWLGSSPTFRKWVGPRLAKGVSEHGITVLNEPYEMTMEFLKREFERDKSGQVLVRVREAASRSAQQWARLLSDLIILGETALCYDGQTFFDVDHSEDASGTQSNDLAKAIATEGENPTVAEMQTMILDAITAIHGFVDGAGEPLNEGSTDFMLMVPTGLWATAKKATQASVIVDTTQAADNILVQSSDLKIFLVQNPRLNAWHTSSGTKFVLFRVDAEVKPFIRIEEGGVETQVIAQGSEHAFKTNKYLFGASAQRGVGYGYWQHAVLVTSTDKS
jgi:phage major head subunit gpT-like protein